MSDNILIVAETGSDLTHEMARELGVYLVPMHITMGNVTLDDGSFPAEEVIDYYNRTHTVPQTSASIPIDYTQVFDAIQKEHPGKQILHMGYSSGASCSFQSAQLALEGRSNILSLDTQRVSISHGVAVIETVNYLKEHPGLSLEEAGAAAKAICERVQMCFIPKNLDYLRAGGRVSNATALVGNLLNLHPCIEVADGSLKAQKKYRGKLNSIIPKVVKDFTEKHDLITDRLYLVRTPGLDEVSMRLTEQAAAELGYHNVRWMTTGCAMTCHGGPGCVGVVGLTK